MAINAAPFEWLFVHGDVVDKLERGAKVADVGCGDGGSTIRLAELFPAAQIWGFDEDDASIAAARKRAERAGATGRVRFEVASAMDFPGDGYALVCLLRGFADVGDPAGATRHLRRAVAPDGRLLVGDRLEARS